MAIKSNFFFDPTLGRPKLRPCLPDKIDILVIGGGIAGLTSLYFLLMDKRDAILLETTDIGFRASGRSLGCIGFPKLNNLRNVKLDFINECLKRNHDILLHIIKKENIICDLTESGEVHLSKNEFIGFDHALKLKNLQIHHLFGQIKTNLHGLFFPVSSSINTFILMNALCQICESYGQRLYGNVSVTNIEKKSDHLLVYTSLGDMVKCKKIIICTPTILAKIHPDYVNFMRVEKINAACTRIMPEKYLSDFMSILHFVDIGYRVRFYWNRLFMDWDGISDSSEAIDIISNYIPLFKSYPLDYEWKDNIFCSSDDLPILGRIQDNIYVNTLYGRHGLSFAFQCSAEICKRLTNKEDVNLFSLERFK